MRHLIQTATCLAVFALAAPTQAGFVAEEFDYGDDNVRDFLDNVVADGGTGWAGPWQDDGGSGEYRVENLDFAADGYISEVGGSWGPRGGGNHIVRDFATPFAAGSTTWGSFLIQSASNGNFGSFNRLRVEINQEPDDRVGFGGVSNQDDGVDPPEPDVEGNLDARVNGQTTVLDSAGIDAINLFVLKMETDYDGVNDRLTVWTNPAGPLSDEASLGTGDVFDPGADIWGSEFASIGVEGRWADGRSFIDAIRFSDQPDGLFQVLTGVPEPGSFALLGLGGLALLRRRRD